MSLGVLRSRRLFLVRVRKLSIEICLLPRHEMVWLQSFVQDLGITIPMLMPMHCDNQAAIFIAGNLAFHERTKHIEIDCHFIREKVLMGVIYTPHVSSSDQLTDILTKNVIDVSYDCLGSKLGMFDLYSPS